MTNENREKIYHSWYQMKSRCLNPKNSDYHRYGGRGITVCSRWLENFENFYEDMHESWFPGATIDRINNDGNYDPANCRWLSRSANSKKSNDERIANGNHPSQNPEARKKMSEKMKQKYQDPEVRKKMSEKMKQMALVGTNPWSGKGMMSAWDLVEQKHVRIHKDLYHANRGRYLHIRSKEYKNLKR